MAQYKDIFKIKHNDLRPEKGKILSGARHPDLTRLPRKPVDGVAHDHGQLRRQDHQDHRGRRRPRRATHDLADSRGQQDGFNIVTELFDLRKYDWWHIVYNNGFVILMASTCRSACWGKPIASMTMRRCAKLS